MEITFKHVDWAPNRQPAILKDVNFTIPDGKLVVFLGSRHSGINAIINLIAGFIRPNQGEIRFDQQTINLQPPQARNIGFLSSEVSLYPQLNVFDNIAFPLKVLKIKKGDRQKRVRTWAQLVNVEKLLKRYPASLSPQQKCRVALARALVKKPDLLLLAAPLKSVLPTERSELQQLILHLQASLGITTIWTTADQDEALQSADLIAIMHHGKIQQLATPEELYHNPQKLFVARFLGHPPINVLPASLIEPAVKKYLSQDIYRHAEFVAIRPEAITLDPPDDYVAHIKAEIKRIDNFGISSAAYIQFQEQELVSSAISDYFKQADQLTDLYFAAQGTYFFDPQGQRIAGGQL